MRSQFLSGCTQADQPPVHGAVDLECQCYGSFPVATSEQVRQSLIRFNAEAKRFPARALKLLRQTTYWVYDDDSENFGPAKFVGFADMSFAKYEEAVNQHHTGARVDSSPPMFLNCGTASFQVLRVLKQCVFRCGRERVEPRILVQPDIIRHNVRLARKPPGVAASPLWNSRYARTFNRIDKFFGVMLNGCC